jgi:hypothetical protein
MLARWNMPTTAEFVAKRRWEATNNLNVGNKKPPVVAGGSLARQEPNII